MRGNRVFLNFLHWFPVSLTVGTLTRMDRLFIAVFLDVMLLLLWAGMKLELSHHSRYKLERRLEILDC